MVKLERVGISGLKRLVALFGYRLTKSDEIDILSPLLARMLNNTDNFFFVQIGGNDGKSFDPIFDFITRNHTRLKGIILEPMQDIFEELKNNYRKCHNIKCINKAIHNTKEEMLLYRVDPAKADKLPGWTKGIASFNPNHHKQSNIPTDCIITESVPCLSFARLLADYDIQNINLLQIDTEGYDVQILMNIDFDIIRPSIIHFEHGLAEGIMDHKTFDQVSERLRRYGYQILVEPYDATAYQLEIVGCTAPAHNQAI